MAEGSIRTEHAEGIGRISIDRPPVNALDQATMEHLTRAFDDMGDTPDVGVIVLTGIGKVFCAGSDMKLRAGVSRQRGDTARYQRSVRAMFDSVLECPIPVVAAINGPALGSGLALAAVSDLLVASTEASFGLPEIDVGLLGGGQHAARLLGAHRARRTLLTGYRYPASDLAAAGVLDWCVPPEQLFDVSTDLARAVADKNRVAVTLAKRSLRAAENLSLRDGYRVEQEFTADLVRHREGTASHGGSTERGDMTEQSAPGGEVPPTQGR